MKRFVSLVAAIGLLFSLTPVVVASTDTLHGCDILNDFHEFGGDTFHNAAGDAVRGVKATINPNFALCKYTQDNGDSVWNFVAIVPSGSNNCGSAGHTNCVWENAILQVGIVLCNDYDGPGAPNGNSDACQYGVPHYFYALGGCDGANPFAFDLGAADYNQHTYEIKHGSAGTSYYHFLIDGVEQNININSSAGPIGCWINQGQQQAFVSSETWDHGNSFGDSGAQTIFSSIGYRITDSGTIYGPGWTSTSVCDTENPPNWRCDISNTIHDQMYTWTN